MITALGRETSAKPNHNPVSELSEDFNKKSRKMNDIVQKGRGVSEKIIHYTLGKTSIKNSKMNEIVQ